MKLKLLHSLYAGRFCVANPLMISGSGLEELCNIYSKPSQAVEIINRLMETDFPVQQITEREKVLERFNNPENARKIISVLETTRRIQSD